MNKNILIALVVLAVALLAGGFWAYNSMKPATVVTPVSQTPEVAVTPSTKQSAQSPLPQDQNTITLSAVGFSPATLTVKVGTKVTFVNNSGETAQIDSDPHPIHTSYPPLNLGTVENGKDSVSIVFDKAGTYKYHNHLNPSEGGTIVVQ